MEVPQGSVLAPLLFIGQVNNTLKALKNKFGLYADDTTWITGIPLIPSAQNSTSCVWVTGDRYNW